MSWTRLTPLDPGPADRVAETWWYDGEGGPLSCPVEVTVGKKLDVAALKGADIAEVVRYAGFLKEAAARLFHADAATRRVDACPACAGPAADLAEAIEVFGVAYLRCGRCGHGFVGRQPSTEILNGVFAESDQHASLYVDPETLEARMRQVVRPKLDWVLGNYERHVGGRPATAIDVGAGGGHFVAECRRTGIEAAGFELSRASRRFAREAFGVDLIDADFTSPASAPETADLVTFWGLLEYTPDPKSLLDAARRRLAGGGMLIVEVPRLNCLGTAVQAQCGETVARHMDPTSHVNCFSDASLATLLVRSGFRPVAAWYFGLDLYELLVQVAVRLDGDATFERLADLIPALQASLDQGRASDDLVVAAVPLG